MNNDLEKYSPPSLVRVQNCITITNKLLISLQKKILIIDDSKSISDHIKYYLVKNGYLVTQALNGETGYNELNQNQYDCLLLNIQMPGVQGDELLEIIRSTGFTLPIIMISIYGHDEMIIKCLRNGADYYLTVPLDFDELSAVVERLIQRHDYLSNRQKLSNTGIIKSRSKSEFLSPLREPHTKRILVVNDDETTAYLLSEQLIEEGYQVDCVYDGDYGLEAIKKTNYDCVLLNWIMERIHGDELLKIVRKTNNDLPIIIHSGDSNAVVKAKFMKLGADYYIELPYNIDELLAAVERVLEIYSL